ncbi:B-cell receptor CD22-like isoform X2 [Sander lucioperca]|uniref:B-cell receptor CD22-like isoform X2 n=1 Tax=Sander lucioperca TaxID=283035 RepID=UPI0016535F68|nr:B-cell receptor CD22-like isoform X2 [Sander lucioperca]
MSLTAAASGFVVFLLSVQVIQGQNDWGVTYTSTQICAVKGSTVEIHCSYRYPSRINATVERTFWFTKLQDKEPVDLRTDSKYSGRVQYRCHEKSCTLRISDLRERDSAEYKFRFITNQDGKYSGLPGVTLSVTGFQVQIGESRLCRVETCTWAELECHSSCSLPGRSSYIWYKNGKKINQQSFSYSDYSYPTDSYSCTLNAYKDFPSPSVCGHGHSCNTVTYTDRSVCAFKGSSVDISCTYKSLKSIKSTFWFSPERSRRWQNPSQPEDLKTDSQYADRVHVATWRGYSTLRISDLRESDSAEYHFKFITPNFEWRSSLPGTTLTVTDPDLQVQVIWSSTGPKLICHSSCLTDRSSFLWYKNEIMIQEETSPSYGGHVDPADSYSCSYQRYRSTPVYAPKLFSVLRTPPGDIMKNDSVTLTCSSDANPAAKYTWYKENQTLLSEEPQLVFSSIQPSDSGQYYCTAQNELGRRTSESVFINVNYGPKLPSVSVSPSAEIVEGSSVTLTCSSDANPAANYTWYKENEDSPKASGQIFTITDFRAEHSGNYYCEAQNRRGRQNSTLHLTVVAGAWKSAATGTITAVLLVILLPAAFLWIRRKHKSVTQSNGEERPDNRAQINMGPAATQRQPAEQEDDLNYSSICFPQNQGDALYSNIRPPQPRRQTEEQDDDVDYTTVKTENGSSAPGTRRQDDGEDVFALYSTVNK